MFDLKGKTPCRDLLWLPLMEFVSRPIGIVPLTLRCLSRSNLMRALHFLVNAHDPVFEISSPIDKNWVPLALPLVKEEKGKACLIPYCHTDTGVNNLFRSRKRKLIGKFERKALEICNGKQSIEEIHRILTHTFGDDGEWEKEFNLFEWIEKMVEKKMILLFKKTF